MIVNTDPRHSEAERVALATVATPLDEHELAWESSHTGGGCMAWRSECDDSAACILICDDGNGLGDAASSFWLVGLHPHEEWNDHWQDEAKTLEEALNLATLAMAARAFALGFRADAQMTFREFLASGRDVADVGAIVGEPEQDGMAGRVYADDSCYISGTAGDWSLTISNGSWDGPLPGLERRLFEYAAGEGYLKPRAPAPASVTALPTLAALEALAATARPLNDDDWGSDRQVDAENAFFDEASKVAPELDSDSGSAFASFCLKATTEEMLDEALRILRGPAPAADARPQWQREFPDFPAGDMPAIPAGWYDASWHNDASPSFGTHNGLQVYIETADPAEREMPDWPRYNVNHIDQYGYDGDDGAFGSDDWQAVIDFVAAFVTPAPTQDQLDALATMARTKGGARFETEMTAELEAYAKAEGLPLHSADEMHATACAAVEPNAAHVSYLSAFMQRWEAVAHVTDEQSRAAAAPPMTELEAVRTLLAAEYVKRIGYDPFADSPTISAAEVAQTLIEHGDENAKAALDCVAEAVATARRNAFPA